MKNERSCTYLRRDEAIVAYLYGESGDPLARTAFASHLESCAICREEVHDLQGVRRHLAAWEPPAPRLTSEPVFHRTMSPPTGGASWTSFAAAPWWAQAAAAVLCVGVGLGAANVHVTSGPDGVSVRTGWWGEPGSRVPPETTRPSAAADGPAPWQTAIHALEERVRGELAATRTEMASADFRQSPGPRSGDVESVLRQVRALVAESERRQQRELALRMGGLLADVQAQRAADLSKIDRNLGLIQNSTGMEVLRQRELINSLAIRVSQRP